MFFSLIFFTFTEIKFQYFLKVKILLHIGITKLLTEITSQLFIAKKLRKLDVF